MNKEMYLEHLENEREKLLGDLKEKNITTSDELQTYAKLLSRVESLVEFAKEDFDYVVKSKENADKYIEHLENELVKYENGYNSIFCAKQIANIKAVIEEVKELKEKIEEVKEVKKYEAIRIEKYNKNGELLDTEVTCESDQILKLKYNGLVNDTKDKMNYQHIKQLNEDTFKGYNIFDGCDYIITFM